MRLASLTGECVRNIQSGTTRAAVGVVMLTGVIVAAFSLDGLAMRNSLLQQRELLNSGASTITVTAPGGIDPERCAALSDVPGVRGAFALRAADRRLTIGALPDSSVSVYDVVGDPLDVLGGATTEPTGIFLARQLAHELSVVPGDDLALLEVEPAGVAGVFNYPDDGRNSLLAASVLQPSPGFGEFDSCWFTLWPPSEALESLGTSVLISGIDLGAVTTAQLNQSAGRPGPTHVVLAQRSTRYLPVGAAILAALTAFTLVRLRRVEFATARHLGQTRSSQVLQILIETSSWALTSVAVAAAVLLQVLTSFLTNNEVALVLTNLFAGLTGVLLAALGGATAAALSISERRMHAWSRDR